MTIFDLQEDTNIDLIFTGAHSSGTSYEQSVDCPTTSNVHSIDYHQETTVCKYFVSFTTESS